MDRYDLTNIRPSIPEPLEIGAEERIRQLERYLEEEELQSQRVNIEALIKMYKTGQLKSLLGPPHGTATYLCGGEVFLERPSDDEIKNRPMWIEVISQQMVQQEGTRAEQLEKRQMKTWSLYETPSGTMHKFNVALRLKPIDPSRTAENDRLPYVIIEIANDTGSNILSLFKSDLASLNYNGATYHAAGGKRTITTASGTMECNAIVVQLRVLDADGYRMTDWFNEDAIILEDTMSGRERLSGANIRHELYFATDREQRLFTEVSKNAIFQYMK